MNVEDVRVFIPSKDYSTSIAFYQEIGFEGEKANDELTLFSKGDCFFFLQNFYSEQFAQNFMLQICVSNIKEAYELCSKSKHKTKISPVEAQSWGKVFYLWGPSGELLHITELSD